MTILRVVHQPVPHDFPEANHYESCLNVSLIRWMLSLTPEQRLDVLQGFVDRVAVPDDSIGIDDAIARF